MKITEPKTPYLHANASPHRLSMDQPPAVPVSPEPLPGASMNGMDVDKISAAALERRQHLKKATGSGSSGSEWESDAEHGDGASKDGDMQGRPPAALCVHADVSLS